VELIGREHDGVRTA